MKKGSYSYLVVIAMTFTTIGITSFNANSILGFSFMLISLGLCITALVLSLKAKLKSDRANDYKNE